MSTTDKLNKILETKEGIKNAITAKGGSVGEVFAEYPAAIESLPTGGTIDVAAAGMKFGYSTFKEVPPGFDFSNVVDGTRLFYSSDLERFETEMPNVTALNYAFYDTKISDVSFISNYPLVTDWSYAFSGNTSYIRIYTIGANNLPSTSIRNIYSIFSHRVLESPWKLSGTLVAAIFLDAKVEEVDITDVQFSSLSQYSTTNLFSGVGVKYLTGSIDMSKFTTYVPQFDNSLVTIPLVNISKTLNLSKARCLSWESAYDIITKLNPATGQTITFHQDVVNQLEDSHIQEAIDKGWTVSPSKSILAPITVTSSSDIPSGTVMITPKTFDLSNYQIGSIPSTWKYLEASLPKFPAIYFGQGLYYLYLTIDNPETSVTYPQVVSGVGNTLIEVDIHLNNWEYITSMNKSYSMVSLACPLDVSHWNTSNVTNFNECFSSFSGTIPSIGTLNMSSCTTARFMFTKSQFHSLDLSNWNCPNLTSMIGFVADCPNLTEIRMPTVTSSSLSLEQAFKNTPIEEIDLSSISSTVALGLAFQNCSKLKKVTITSPISGIIGNPFDGVTTTGTLYYNPDNNYTTLINHLPSTWTAVPIQ